MQTYTNAHLNFLLRRLAPDVTLWTEMEKAADVLACDDATLASLLAGGADDAPPAVRDAAPPSCAVSLKCRAGVRETWSDEAPARYGSSTRANRCRPPLHPDFARRLARDFPALRVTRNGGIGSFGDSDARDDGLDGVMAGRAVLRRPLDLGCAADALGAYADYVRTSPRRAGARRRVAEQLR
ncbi:tRNA dihydrouridine synthase [Aureococcus anophagefferens]|nr:tRNA dihydrouridine synthase [Aureococcus anophagefferens]